MDINTAKVQYFTERFQNLVSTTNITTLLQEHKIIYMGIDPTAPTLHVGHLYACQLLKTLTDIDHTVLIVLGGSTGLVGDPTDKNELRPMLAREQIDHNCIQLTKQINHLIPKAQVLNNTTWIEKLNLVDFLRDMAKHFSVNQLIKLETFANRLNNQEFLSAMEFLYPLLVAYDFDYLYHKYSCTVQVGGLDQWGNVTQSIHYLRRKYAVDTHGLFMPLCLAASGEKMSKSAKGGTIWLDANMTAPFDFWQYWRNIPDSQLISTARMFTHIPDSKLQNALQAIPDINHLKIQLASVVTTWVHGHASAVTAEAQANDTFKHSNTNSLPKITLEAPDALKTILKKILIELKIDLVQSLTAYSHNLIVQKAVRVDGQVIQNPKFIIDKDCIIHIAKKHAIFCKMHTT